MSSSDFSISSDWDIIDDIKTQLDSDGEESKDDPPEDLKGKENVQEGSCVDDILPLEEEVNCEQEEDPCVPNVTEPEINNHHENSSSSEFDVLDEAVEDNQISISFSLMDYSISSSLGESHPSLVPEEAETETEDYPRPLSYRDYVRVHPFLLAATISFGFMAIMLSLTPLSSIKQLKDRLSTLQSENNELKNLVQAKLENDKILLTLEEQIKSLKDENFKLSGSMETLVAQLEEQTELLRKDKEAKEQDPYRSEIEKLKEQINILQMDNEELQTQLIRMRYGIYSPPSKESKTEEKDETNDDKPDGKDNRDNSSEVLVEEINELRKKLYIEVEKLKTWKDSVQHLVKKLGNGHAGSQENEKQNFEGAESFDHSEKERMRKSKPGKKDKKYSDWSWRDIKKNLRERFEGLQDIDVPNFISNYVDKKKIEGVFESVGHYFKKAQEKTKKVLVSHNDVVNQEMSNFFGRLRNQWNDLSNKYYKKYYPEHAKAEEYKSQFSKHKSSMRLKNEFESENKFDEYQEQRKPKKPSNEQYDHTMYPDVESFTASPAVETPDAEKIKMAQDDREASEDNSWVFKRAAHRSQLREEEQEAFTNWFLKRGRDFHYNEEDSLKEWLKETYRNGNSDED